MSPHAYKRTILITGATDGIGKQLALELSSRPDENFLILHGRTKRKCEQTIEWLCHENKVTGFASNLDYIAADFSRMTDTARMADEVKLRFPRLNIMVSCAAVVLQRKRSTEDGLEMMLQVNHLSHYILWRLLLPLLEANAPSRIITVGSILHSINPIDWTDVQCEKHTYDKLLQYSRTKLMNDLATFYIHRLLFKHGKQFQVTANVVEADEKTERRATTGTFNVFSASESHLNCIHKSSTVGLQTLVRLVEHLDYEGVSGKYFDGNGKELRKIADLGQWSQGEEDEAHNVLTEMMDGMALVSNMTELLAERVAKDAKRDLCSEVEREYPRVAAVVEHNFERSIPTGRLRSGSIVEFSTTLCLRYKLDVLLSETSQLSFDVECRPQLKITLGPMERETCIDELTATAHAFIRNDLEERIYEKFDEIAEAIKRKINEREEDEGREGRTGRHYSPCLRCERQRSSYFPDDK